MGGSPSKMPPIMQRDPLPDSGAIDGFSKGQGQGCKRCVLTVAKGISASGAKIYREQGTISYKECEQLKIDSTKVNEKKLAFNEFKSKLLGGKYFNDQGNGYCSQLMFNSSDLQAVNDIQQVPWNKAIIPSIRKLTTSGGFSSLTKLFIKPAIPFNVTFNGEQITVNTMTLFHPCPIRIENIQYDAVLTLGDAADESTKTIIMIPLKGAMSPGKSGAFISKIVQFIPGILMPDPATGQYKQIDVPTGKDWDLSSMFPGSPQGSATVVDAPYFVWNPTPPMELYLRNTIVSPWYFPDIQQYGWKPSVATEFRKFIMLADAVPVNTFDLQTIRMLPTTPSEDAIPPPLMKSLLFKPNPKCSSGKETFVVKEEDSCDPLANIPKPDTIDKDTIIAVVLGVISTIAIFVGIYFGMKYAGGPIGNKLKEWGEKAGKMFAGMGRKIPTPIVPEGTFEMENPLVKAKRDADARQERLKKLDEAGEALEERVYQEQQAKKKEEEQQREEAAKKVYDEEQDKKKELEEQIKDTSLPEAEQKQIRKEYQKLTGIYHPTKREQEAAAGTGLVKRRNIESSDRALVVPEDEGDSKKLAQLEEQVARDNLKELEKKKEQELKEYIAKQKGIEQEKLKKRQQTEALSRSLRPGVKPPPVPSGITKNLPPPPSLKPVVAKLEQKKDEMNEQQKVRIEKARERIDKAVSETRERKMKEALADLKDKQAADREKVERDLAAAQARLKASQSVYRRGQQKRNTYTGRGKTRRN